MNKRFFTELYFIFFCFAFSLLSCTTQTASEQMSQKSIRELKSDILSEFQSRSDELTRKIESLEKDLQLNLACTESEADLKVVKQELAAVQKKIGKLASVFNKRPSGALFDWRKSLFYTINTGFIVGAFFVLYKIIQKISSSNDENERKKAYLLAGGIVCAFLIFQFLIYYFSDGIAIAASDAEALDAEKYAHVYKIIEELCAKANIPATSLFVMNDAVPNAFATGPWPSRSSIVVSKGLLDLLNDEELKSVFSHELSHIRNYDVLTESIFFILSLPLLLVSDKVKHSHDKSKADIDNEDVSFNDVSNFILFRFLGWSIKCALKLSRLFISRSVEYRADQEGAALSENPLALASALDKMRKSSKSPFFGKKDAKNGSNLIDAYFELFSTHPLDKKRIERLKELDSFYREKIVKLLDK